MVCANGENPSSVYNVHVDCSNLSEPDNSLTFDSCDEASWEDSGVLRVLGARGTFSFNNNNAFCTHLLILGALQSNVACECKEEGQLLSCQNVGCELCGRWEGECYTWRSSVQIDHSVNNTHPIAVSGSYRYVPSSRYNGTEVFVTENLLVESCKVFVNGDECSSCNFVTCDDAVIALLYQWVHQASLQVDCSNLSELGAPSFDACNPTTWNPSSVLQVLQPIPPCS